MTFAGSWEASVRVNSPDELRQVVRGYPILDNHAHNLLRRTELDKHAFESITTEAHGSALRDTSSSLPHIRALAQLKELYDTDASDWDSIKQARQRWLDTQPDELYRRCFDGIHTILMDDGLDPDTVEEYSWHDSFTTSTTRRIVRIETLAEQLLQSMMLQEAGSSSLSAWRATPDRVQRFLGQFKSRFLGEILGSVADPQVAGFKSVICYRTGLNVQLSSLSEDPGSGLPVAAFQQFAADCARTNKVRLNHKQLNDWVLCIALQGILSAARTKYKPIQFHTGLGDNDMSLRASNPGYLQPLIEAFPEITFVLLHAAYPFTREAGYLACVFSNVYLDIGEVFPMISREGQLRVINQALELVPSNKLLWSTDGHWFPETYWLAVKQWRSALETVLVQYVEDGDLTSSQAIVLAKDIMFENSNRMYKLGLVAGYVPKSTAPSTKAPSIVTAPTPTRVPSLLVPVAVPNRQPSLASHTTTNLRDLNEPSLEWVYVQWIEYMGTMRCRMLPIKHFRKVISKATRIGISYGNLGTLQDDTMTPVVNTTGQIIIEPDIASFRQTHKQDTLRRPGVNGGPSSTTATVLSYWAADSGSPLPCCPRGNLARLLRTLESSYGITMQLGFEIEVYFLTSLSASDPTTPPSIKSSDAPHAWSTLSSSQWANNLPMLRDIANALAEMDIDVQQMHAESGPGQWEFVLPPDAPLRAIDTLYQARTAIQQIAQLHGLRATFHPAPLLAKSTSSAAACSGAHFHMSFQGVSMATSPPSSSSSSTSTAISPEETSFLLRGLLPHLSAVSAFTLASSSSYTRVRDGAWTGGSWVAWGTQNREVPLRRVGPQRWEVRCVDGIANVYLAVAAVVAAGLVGLGFGNGSGNGSGGRSGTATPSTPGEPGAKPQAGTPASALLKDCPVPPAILTAARRAEYNITQRMPRDLKTALTALEFDTEIVDVLGKGLVGDYVAMKEAEIEVSGWGDGDGDGEEMDEEERDAREQRRRRRVAWEVERY